MDKFSVNPGALPADTITESLGAVVESEPWLHDHGKPLDGEARKMFDQAAALVAKEVAEYTNDNGEVRVIVEGHKDENEWVMNLYVAKP